MYDLAGEQSEDSENGLKFVDRYLPINSIRDVAPPTTAGNSTVRRAANDAFSSSKYYRAASRARS